MSDEQLHRRMVSKRLLIIALVLVAFSGGLFYYRYYMQTDLNRWKSEKAQENSLRNEIQALESAIGGLSSTIEETGKELVSFSEDKIVYINLASELATKYGVTINELSVSDVWTEGQMAGMTTVVEVQGTFEGVRGFVSEYCGTNHTNRITKIACRPDARFEWMWRYIDDLIIMPWFDLTEEESMYDKEMSEANRENGMVVEDEVRSITLEDMFADYTFKLYLQVDFLGRH